MEHPSRRHLLETLGLLSLLAATQKSAAARALLPSPAASAAPLDLTRCAAIPFDALLANRNQAGVSRPAFSGVVPTGEHIELHETTLLPGHMPHPPHQHRPEELMLLREGTLDFLYGEVSHTLTPGGIAYVASNQLHGLKNIGAAPAIYFVIAIGREDS